MENPVSTISRPVNRRSFMKTGLLAGGAATIGAGFLGNARSAQARELSPTGALESGDVAILQFLAAAELIESDLWIQYAELGGIGKDKPIEVNPNPNPPLNAYQLALSNLDGDGPQYITSNTLDEVSHANFLNAYLRSQGAAEVKFDKFRTLPGSTAKGSTGIKRLTNLMHLNVDTSWFVRYRSATNPDFGVTYPQAVTITNRTAIPRTNADFADADHIQVIANTAAFHFGTIEQGGTSLYAAMSQKVRSAEVLQITLGIGGDEIAHFLEWVDFAGNAVQAPIAPVSDSGLTFPNLFSPLNPLLQPSLIFPVPCEFINPTLPHVSVIRPITSDFGGAMAAAQGFIADGLFVGQSQEFIDLLLDLAYDADQASR